LIVLAIAIEIGFRGRLEEAIYRHCRNDQQRSAPGLGQRLSLVKNDGDGPDAA